GCARSTVAEAIKALEDAGILSWVNRLKRVACDFWRSSAAYTSRRSQFVPLCVSEGRFVSSGRYGARKSFRRSRVPSPASTRRGSPRNGDRSREVLRPAATLPVVARAGNVRPPAGRKSTHRAGPGTSPKPFRHFRELNLAVL